MPPVAAGGVGELDDMLPEDMPPDDAAGPAGIALLEPPLEGAMLPGEAPGAGEAIAAFGAPVGAGEEPVVWAIATPAVIQKAAEASHSERMQNLLK
jgi:hypothetical protein